MTITSFSILNIDIFAINCFSYCYTSVWIFLTVDKPLFFCRHTICIMNPNVIVSNKISMILINLKIINGYNFIIKLFTVDFLNEKSISVIINKLCTYPKMFGIYKAFIFYVKRVIVCSYNCFTVYCKVNQSVYLSDIFLKFFRVINNLSAVPSLFPATENG